LEVPLKIASAIFLFLLLAVPVRSQEGVKIGFVDLDRALNESRAGRRALEKLQAEVKETESSLLKEKQDLERLRSDINKKGLLLKEVERRNLEKEFQRKVRNYQRGMRDSQEELNQRKNELMADILKGLEKVVTEVGKKEKFTLILERSQVLYTDQGVDITDTVISRYDRSGDKNVTGSK
jgi:outer membrane protein